MMVLSHSQINTALQLIEGAHKIVITSHKSPDGDAAGSSLALFHLLKSIGKSSVVILPDTLPDFLHFLPGAQDVVFFDTETEKAQSMLGEADLIFAMDYNMLYRTGEAMESELAKSSASFILIDHHQQPGSFPIVTYSDTSACSTCEMVYNFWTFLFPNEVIGGSAAECIYCGIMTDSGSFRFPSVTARTHEIVAKLISEGLDHAAIHRAVYDTNLLDRLRLVGYALSEKLQVWEDLSTAVLPLTAEELKRFNHRAGDTEGLVNQALSIKGVKVAVFIREGSNELKLSFRSKGSFDVNQFARNGWNGGGHKNAAGGNTNESIDQAIQRLRLDLEKVVNQIQES